MTLTEPSIGQRSPRAALLRLIRVWNLPTAVVDPYAGYLVAAGAGQASAARLVAVMLASAFVYSAGMAANDLFDTERDRTLHPDRPLPSGLIGRKAARRFAALLVALGVGASIFAGWRVLLVCLGLVALTFAYNGWLKDKGLVGCLAMGACRFANMWLGIAAADGAMTRLWPLPATLGLYVTIVTLLSVQEETSLSKQGFFEILSMLLIVLLPLAGFSLAKAARQPSAALSLVPLTLLATWIFGAGIVAAKSLAAAVGCVVRVAVTGIILLDSAFLLYEGKLLGGLICALVLLPALVLIRYTARRATGAPA